MCWDLHHSPRIETNCEYCLYCRLLSSRNCMLQVTICCTLESRIEPPPRLSFLKNPRTASLFKSLCLSLSRFLNCDATIFFVLDNSQHICHTCDVDKTRAFENLPSTWSILDLRVFALLICFEISRGTACRSPIFLDF